MHWTRRLRVAFPGSLLALAILTGCTDSGTPTAAPDSSVQTGDASTPSTTPSGRPVASAAPAPATSPQKEVTGKVIETPPEVLVKPPATTALTNDYTAAPQNEFFVLEATVPMVTIYQSATSNEVKTQLTNPLPSKAPLVFLVDGQTSSRYKVLLPIRPNGSVGWVDPGQVKKYIHKYKIVVERSAHRLTVYNGDEVVLSEKIAVGTADTPSPNGRYYIKELLRACVDVKQPDGSTKCVPNDDGIYGPYAYGLSGFSPTVTNWNGGEGVIGIHGTNQPELLGKDVSKGCIRMSNAGITALSKVLPLGTPVFIKP